MGRYLFFKCFPTQKIFLKKHLILGYAYQFPSLVTGDPTLSRKKESRVSWPSFPSMSATGDITQNEPNNYRVASGDRRNSLNIPKLEQLFVTAICEAVL